MKPAAAEARPPISEADRDLDVLERDQRDEQHHADDPDHRVLAPQVRGGALLDGEGQPAHRLVAGRQREQRATGHRAVHDRGGSADERDDDPVVGQEVGQGEPLWVRSKRTTAARPGRRRRAGSLPRGAARRPTAPEPRACRSSARGPGPSGSPAGSSPSDGGSAGRAGGLLRVEHLQPRQRVAERDRAAPCGAPRRAGAARGRPRPPGATCSRSGSGGAALGCGGLARPALRAPTLSSVTMVCSSTSSTVIFCISASMARSSSSLNWGCWGSWVLT